MNEMSNRECYPNGENMSEAEICQVCLTKIAELEERHMAEIATLEHEIKLVRARNQRLEEEIAWIESVGKTAGK